MNSLPANKNFDGFYPCPYSAYLPLRVDEIAVEDPSRVWVEYPLAPDVTGEWRTSSFQELKQAVDGTARWIERTIGVGKGDGQNVAYIGSVQKDCSCIEGKLTFCQCE